MANREYSQIFDKQSLPDIRGRRFDNALFNECTIGRCTGAGFINCTFRATKFTATDLRDVLGTGVTLDCFFFGGIEVSPPVLDALIHLLTLTKGNDTTRQKLLAIIDPQRLKFLTRFFDTEERS